MPNIYNLFYHRNSMVYRIYDKKDGDEFPYELPEPQIIPHEPEPQIEKPAPSIHPDDLEKIIKENEKKEKKTLPN